MVEKLKLLWSNIYDRGLTFLGTLGMIFDVMPNRLRFIGFMRIFFTSLVIEIGYPNSTWRKGRKTGKVPACNPRIWEFGPKELLAALFEHSGSEPPEALNKGKSQSPAYLSSSHGSPWLLYPRDSQNPDLSFSIKCKPRTHLALFQK